jgi:hypothetical protein
MTKEEKKIWDSVYGSAVVDQVRAMRKAGAPLERAMIGTTEAAIGVADEAVRELRRWRTQENLNAGIFVE